LNIRRPSSKPIVALWEADMRHVDRGACDLVELLPLGPEGSHDQVGDIALSAA
jgi:hypothetical protein